MSVPIKTYTNLLDQRGEDLARIKALEDMLRDAWLVCQGGRPSGDALVVRVLSKRVDAWASVLDATRTLASSRTDRQEDR